MLVQLQIDDGNVEGICQVLLYVLTDHFGTSLLT